MKLILPLLLVFALFVTLSCKKEKSDPEPSQNTNTTSPQTGISYPDSVYFGKNILAMADSVTLSEDTAYSCGAVLGADANLKIIIYNLSSVDTVTGHIPSWFWGGSNIVGWLMFNYNSIDNTQKIISIQDKKIDVNIHFDTFGTNNGKCRMDIYENSNTITRTKFIYWH